MVKNRRGQSKGIRRRGGGGGAGEKEKPLEQPWASAPEADRAWLPFFAKGDIVSTINTFSGWSATCAHGKKTPGPCARVGCFESLMRQPSATSSAPAPPSLRAEGAATGLVNLGNTCYLNALLQPLFAIPELRGVIYSAGSQQANLKIVVALARLFARLAEGMHAAVRPDELAKELALDVTKQQDAPELLALLIAYLREQCGKATKEAVDRIFQGKSVYVTRCNKCSKESKTVNDWSQLQVPLQGTLEEALASLLNPEKLEGANQYNCDACKIRVDAARYVVIEQLPPVLILQCMRFLYDVKIKDKRKVNTVLSFPRTLDLSALSANGAKYQLESAVLHVGVSAHGGHYVAHVRSGAKEWTRFDDAHTAVMTMGAEMDEPVPTHPRNAGERLSSAKVYMLFYRRIDAAPSTPPAVPAALQLWLEQANQELLRINMEYGERAEKELVAHRSRQSESDSLIAELKKGAKANTPGRYISSRVLADYLSAILAGTPRPLLSTPVCSHGAADPAHFAELRFMAEAVYARIAAIGQPALPQAICIPCFASHIKDRAAKAEMARNRDRVIAENLAAKADVRPFVVNKSVLGEWRKAWPYDEKTAQTAGERLLKDMQCSHGKVCHDGRKRELVTEELWSLLGSLYQLPQGLKSDSPNCKECEDELKAKRKEDERLRNERASLRKQFSLLLSPPDAPPTPGVYHLVSISWLDQWRLWLNAAEDAPEKEPLPDSNALLCPHACLPLPPLEAVACKWAVLMPELLRDALTERFPHASNLPQVLVSANNEADATPPACMQGCVADTRATVDTLRLNFVDSEITIAMYEPDAASGEANGNGNGNGDGNGNGNGKPPPAAAAVSSSGSRRSPRKRRGNNKKADVHVRVSAMDTVAELKLKVFEQSDIMPAQQRLRFGDTVLEDNTLPLKVYSVPAGAVLTVESVEGDASEWVSMVDVNKAGDETAFEKSALVANSDTEGDESMEDRASEWSCQACTFNNEASATHCQVCEAKK